MENREIYVEPVMEVIMVEEVCTTSYDLDEGEGSI